ncbi:MAG: hypothetical protein IPN34_14990 [Planctomycetes bacterium]|nr:hypothetical protein [Planctomycetota bacterium]
MTIPEGWTDDMNVSLPVGRTHEELARRLLALLLKQAPYEVLIATCRSEFLLSEADCELAVDRIQGGAIRALTGAVHNQPQKEKDAIAWWACELLWAKPPETVFAIGDELRTLHSTFRRQADGRWIRVPRSAPSRTRRVKRSLEKPWWKLW